MIIDTSKGTRVYTSGIFIDTGVNGTSNPISVNGITRFPLLGINYSQDSYADFVTSLSTTGCTVDDLGLCSDGVNHIYGLQIGDPAKPCIFLTACLHGNEWQPAYVLRYFMRLMAHPSSLFAHILSRFQVYAIPVVNPAGYIANARLADGIDINRDFNPPKTTVTTDATGICYWQTYHDAIGDGGDTTPFEAPEAVIVGNKVLELDPVFLLDCHSEASTGFIYQYVIGKDEVFWNSVISRVSGLFTSTLQAYALYPLEFIWAKYLLASNGLYPITGLIEMSDLTHVTFADASYRSLNFILASCLQLCDWLDSGYTMTLQFGRAYVPLQAGVTANNNTLTVSPDTQINSGNNTANYGTYPTIAAGKNSGGIRRGLLRWDLSNIVPAGCTVASAILTLNLSSQDNTTPRTVGVHRALTQWYEGARGPGVPPAGEDGSTWNLRNVNGPLSWGAAGGLADTDYVAAATDSQSVSVLGAVSFDVTADVQAWADGGDNYGWWVINADEATEGSQKLFTSSGGTLALTPKLIIRVA